MDTHSIISFLQQLEKNNNREWFVEHKPDYEYVKNEFEKLLNALIPQIRNYDESLPALSAKDCMYRIYRDVRFSANKEPFKTHIGGFIAKGGKKSINAGYYIHLEPGNSFVGGGMWCPEPELLKKVRWDIYNNIDEFKEIVSDKKFIKLFGALDDENKLVRPPKDFPADFPEMDFLKYKSYVVLHALSNDDLKSGTLIKKADKAFQALYPLNRFLNEVFN